MALSFRNSMFQQNDVRETVTNTVTASVLFNLDYARYESKISHSEAIRGLCFSKDGKYMYITYDNAGASTIAQWTLTSPWDVTTATQTNTLDVDSTDTAIRSVYVSTCGLRIFFFGVSNNDAYQFNMSTAWDLSTATDSTLNINVGGDMSNPGSMTFREDGKEVFFGSDVGAVFGTYLLDTAFDFTTSTFIGDHTGDAASEALIFSRDGTKLFSVSGAGVVYIYTLAVPYIISSETGSTLYTILPDGNAYGIFFKPNGHNMYIGTNDTELIQQYHLSRTWRV